jgi:hypothetical protein
MKFEKFWQKILSFLLKYTRMAVETAKHTYLEQIVLQGSVYFSVACDPHQWPERAYGNCVL